MYLKARGRMSGPHAGQCGAQPGGDGDAFLRHHQPAVVGVKLVTRNEIAVWAAQSLNVFDGFAYGFEPRQLLRQRDIARRDHVEAPRTELIGTLARNVIRGQGMSGDGQSGSTTPARSMQACISSIPKLVI